jgi:hypothetical protein
VEIFREISLHGQKEGRDGAPERGKSLKMGQYSRLRLRHQHFAKKINIKDLQNFS